MVISDNLLVKGVITETCSLGFSSAINRLLVRERQETRVKGQETHIHTHTTKRKGRRSVVRVVEVLERTETTKSS